MTLDELKAKYHDEYNGEFIDDLLEVVEGRIEWALDKHADVYHCPTCAPPPKPTLAERFPVGSKVRVDGVPPCVEHVGRCVGTGTVAGTVEASRTGSDVYVRGDQPWPDGDDETEPSWWFRAADVTRLEPEPAFKVGDRVEHARCGLGTVRAIRDDHLRIEFDNDGYGLDGLPGLYGFGRGRWCLPAELTPLCPTCDNVRWVQDNPHTPHLVWCPTCNHGGHIRERPKAYRKAITIDVDGRRVRVKGEGNE